MTIIARKSPFTSLDVVAKNCAKDTIGLLRVAIERRSLDLIFEAH